MMSEFVCMEDWDLQAVVRGCNSAEAFTNIMNNSPSSFAPLSFDQDDFSAFPEIFETTTDLDGLEGLYKPFYPVFHQTISPQNNLTTTASMSIPTEVKEPQKVQKKQVSSESATSATSDATQAIKSKRRLVDSRFMFLLLFRIQHI